MSIQKFNLWLASLAVAFLVGVSLWFLQHPGTDPSFTTTSVTLPVELPERPFDYSYDDLQWVAKNVYFEARNQSVRGQTAVAYVTINRFLDPRWPRTFKGVITERNGGQCQFSWVCTLGAGAKPGNAAAWDVALTVATRAMNGTSENPVGNAMFFHASHAPAFTWLGRSKRLRIQDHVFYSTAAVAPPEADNAVIHMSR